MKRVVVRQSEPLRGTLRIQPSKNYLARWLWTSALCEKETGLEPVLPSDDARAMLACVRELGAEALDGSLEEGRLRLRGFGMEPSTPAALNPDNAGAVLRFVLGAAALGGPIRFESKRMDSLGKRPNIDLVRALEGWGVHFKNVNAEGTLPLESDVDFEKAHPAIQVSGETSSQYVSSLLMVAPLVAKRLGREVSVEVTGGLKSQPAVVTTLDVMHQRGIQIEVDHAFRTFFIEPAGYAPGDFAVNGDWPGAAALLCAAAAVPKSRIRLEGLKEDAQGERGILQVLEAMGCRVEFRGDSVSLTSPDKLEPLRAVDGDIMTDAVPPLMAACALADGRSRVENVENLRYKECNRISDPLAELRKLSVTSREELAAFEIDGRPGGFEGGVELHGYKDHRVIFMLTILGLRSRRPVEIATAEHVAKSYPRFFEDLRALGAPIEAA